MDTFTVRRMHIDDLDEIQNLYAHQITADKDPLSKLRITPKQHQWEMRRIRQQWLTEQRYLAFVATVREDESQPEKFIGYIAALVEHQARLFDVETIASIGELWVLEEFRNRGVGQALTASLLDMIDQLGIEWVTINVAQDNQEVMDFFKKSGFSLCAVEMRRNLSEQFVTDDSETGSNRE